MRNTGGRAGFLHRMRGTVSQYLDPKTPTGKVTFAAMGTSAFILLVMGLFIFQLRVPTVSADNVSTSVTVLNTPPTWVVDAQESTESSTSTPTNAGATITWVATAADSGLDNYYLLICKTSGAPTANVTSAPTCNGGVSNQWAVSVATTQNTQASAATTTHDGFPFNNESNDWYAWVCDGNSSLPLCNATVKQGSGTTASPFVIDHPPVFTAVSNNSPQDPGSSLTWSVTAHSTDTLRGGDTVKLYVCKAADFSGSSCGAGGTYATSTFAASDPTASYTITVPTQDNTYSAFVYVTNNFNLQATSTNEGTNKTFTVNNVAPTVSAATVTLVDPVHSSSTIVLATPAATSGPYWVQFQVSDNNSCQNKTNGQEVSSAIVNVYRSGVGSTSCTVAGDYNANSCYPNASALTDFVCTQDAGSCSGPTSVTATWTCRFSLWYNADPTDSGSVHSGETWNATVKATDDNSAQSPLTESTIGSKTLTSFLAFDVPETAVAFGGLQPGQQNDPLATTTTLKALGNVGLDETVYGDTMCPSWSGADSCDVGGFNANNQIPITNQKVSTSSVAYAATDAYALAGSTTPVSVGIHVLKTTATSTPQSKQNFWGIHIPNAITVSGNYFGQDTITAVKSAAANW